MTEHRLTWRDFPRPGDDAYYEARSPYLSQGDLLADAPMLVLPLELLVEEGPEGGLVAAVPLSQSAAVILSPTCDFRRQSIEYLAEHPDEDAYQLRQTVVVARVMPQDVWERAQVATGRSERLRQLLAHDNQRQYMYLPPIERLGASLIDFGTTWTLPLPIALGLERITQLALPSAQQLQFKLVQYGTAIVVQRDSLRPPMD
jgi:hypothetical protein